MIDTPFPDDEDYDIKPGQLEPEPEPEPEVDDELPAHVIRQRAARRRFMEGVDSGNHNFL